jgi:trimeric autotransporter adhesin
MRQPFVRCAYATFLLFTFASLARAQSFQGGLRGAVKEEDDRVIPGVTVTLVNQATNISRETVSNGSGEYSFPAVTPGTYSVKAVLEGFRTFERKGLAIGTQQFITLDLTMQVGSFQEAITVTGAAPLLETSNASVGRVLDNKTIEALPALNRNAYMSAVITVPTVQAQGNPYFSRMEDQSNGSLVSLGGGPLRANNYLLDGVSVTDLTGRTSVFVTPEAIEELKVQVHTYDAEMGRSGGGVFNTTGRSGGNTFHGTGFGQVRPNWSLKEPYFDQLAGKPKLDTPYYRYWGGSVGGPIKENKTFFWFAHEGYQTGSAQSASLYLPTNRELAGDFSQTFDKTGKLIVLYDPATTTQLANGTYTRSPFPNNVIPFNRISPIALAIAQYLPKPDTQVSAAGGVPNKQVTVPVQTWADQYYTKLEHKVTERDTITGLYLAQPDNEGAAHYWQGVSPAADPGQGTEVRRAHIVALNNLYVPNNTTVVSLRYGWTFFQDNEEPYSGFNVASLGFPASFVNGVTFQKFPNATLEGYPNPSYFFGNRAVQRNLYKSWAANGSVSKLMGRQTIKYGADFRQISVAETGPDLSSGNFSFAKTWTQQNPLVANSSQGSAFGTFLLGVGTGTTPVVTPLEFYVRYGGVFVQDDVRVNSTFTMNAGLRYEYESGMHEVGNRFSVNFDQNAVNPLSGLTGMDLRGGLVYAGQNGEPAAQGDPQKLKLSPRGGFSWAMNPSTVIRGGYGLFWSPFVYSAPGSANYGQTGYTATNQIYLSSNVFPTDTVDNPYPNGLAQPTGNSLGLLTGAGGTINYVPLDRKSPYVQQYSIEVQHELPGEMAVSLSYVGARGDNLSYGGSSTAFININTLTPAQMALGSALNNQVKNPFYGIAQAGPFSLTPTIAYGQLLRPFPEFGDVFAVSPSGAKSRYNAVIFELNKRISHGFGGRFSYTWSRLDDSQFGQGSYFSPSTQTRPLDSRNPDAEYSRSLLDVPNRIVAAPLLELPFGKGQRWATGGLSNALAGGWMVSAVATYDAGSPINVTQADNTGSFGGVQRPNLTSTAPSTPGATLDRLTNYINPAAYSAAAPFTFGNAPRTDPNLRTPGRSNLDLVMAKTVPLPRRAKGQFRIEMLNATNTPKFVGPASQFGVSTFGTITTQAGFSRTTQFMFRVDW